MGKYTKFLIKFGICDFFKLFKLDKINLNSSVNKSKLYEYFDNTSEKQLIICGRTISIRKYFSRFFVLSYFSNSWINNSIFFVYSPSLIVSSFEVDGIVIFRGYIFPSILLFIFSCLILLMMVVSFIFLPIMNIYVTFILKDDSLFFPVTAGFLLISIILMKIFSKVGRYYREEKNILIDALKMIIPTPEVKKTETTRSEGRTRSEDKV